MYDYTKQTEKRTRGTLILHFNQPAVELARNSANTYIFLTDKIYQLPKLVLGCFLIFPSICMIYLHFCFLQFAYITFIPLLSSYLQVFFQFAYIFRFTSQFYPYFYLNNMSNSLFFARLFPKSAVQKFQI